jgi:hypothetical protein
MYSALLVGYNAWKRQARLTATAVLKSFETESIYFLLCGSHYIPFRIVSSDFPFLRDNVPWTYSIETSTFYESTLSDTTLSTRLPYIGASLRRGSTTLGDMSEWIQDQVVYATKGSSVPLQVLVAAWALSNSILFDYTYNDYILTVMDIEGDELEYNVGSGERVEVTTDELEEVDSIPQSEEDLNASSLDNAVEDDAPSEYIPTILELKEQ